MPGEVRVAYVIFNERLSAETAELAEHLRARLAPY